MNWDAVGALGELIGAGAVVVSLVYLAVQIRGQNIETRTAGMHAVSAGFRDSIGSLAEIPHVARVWIKSNEDPDSLTDEELVQMFAVAQRISSRSEAALGRFEAVIKPAQGSAGFEAVVGFAGDTAIAQVVPLLLVRTETPKISRR